ncbi:hypothetical protein [uncultured Pseudomonas sp.]|uniref:hypothetical protein n=1 Tax=uncultured Pseudomonas sp. TaxID=114707 RepID=UPI0025CF6A73|nr:hypothetical protein [uncultured Pseudomonas sp.]
MTGNSLDSLVAWMKDEPRTYGSDAIFALAIPWLNQALLDLYTTRLSAQDHWQLPTLSAEVPETSFTHYFSGLILGAPAFSLQGASLETPRVALRLPLLAGHDLLVDTVAGNRSIVRLSSWAGEDGIELLLNVEPQGEQRQVNIDLAGADNVQLQFPGTPAEQREAGRAIQAWLQGLESGVRQWPVAALPNLDHPLMHIGSLAVRLQAAPATQRGDNADGALLLFVGLAPNNVASVPTQGSGFRYLLPDDAEQAFSFTALFAGHLVHRAALGLAVQGLLEGGQFEFQPANGVPARMVATSGALRVPATSLASPQFEFRSEAFTLQAADTESPLAAHFDHTGARQVGVFACETAFSFKALDASGWRTYTGSFQVRVEYQFHVLGQASARYGMQGQLFVPYDLGVEAEPLSGLPALPAEEMEQIQGFIAQTVKRRFLHGLAEGLTLQAPESFLESVEVSERYALQPDVRALPLDLALFGRLAEPGANWHVVPHPAAVVAGERLQLRAEPEQADLTWSVLGLPGSSGDPGSIDAQGLYRAPPAHAMNASVSRVLVMARQTATGQSRLALLTVSDRPISVNPLIQVCNHGERLELTAHHPAGQSLEWAIKDPQPGESGTLEPGGPFASCTYVAAARVADKTYVLDEIQVIEPQSGKAQSAYVLVRQAASTLVIKPDPEAFPGEARLQLHAQVGGTPRQATWSLPLGGPGFIDEQGVYEASASARQAFVLVFAHVAMPELDLDFDGHLILPLPLGSAPALLRDLAGSQ